MLVQEELDVCYLYIECKDKTIKINVNIEGLFGKKVARQFNQLNGLELIARAHQLVQDGYKYHFEKKNVITVWSAPNYVYRCGNVASILCLDENRNRNIQIFKDTEESRQVVASMKRPVPYFL